MAGAVITNKWCLVRMIGTAAVVACHSTTGPAGSPSDYGTLEGEVTVLGAVAPGNSTISAFTSAEDLFLRRNGRQASMSGSGMVLTFRMDSVRAGVYFLEACVSFGCRFYGVGEPEPVEVRGGRTTSVEMEL